MYAARWIPVHWPASGLVEQMLARARDPAGEGARVFLKLYANEALAQAMAFDSCRKAGLSSAQLGPLAGIPISVKDLFDIAGEVTTAGSVVLRDNAPAVRDAPAMQRLRRAGAILIGRTNMTEWAYGAVGVNGHFGTPRSVWDRGCRRRRRQDSGRVDLGRRGVGQRRDGGGDHRLGHRGLGAHTRCAERAGRLQAHRAARAADRRLSAVAAGFDRTAGALPGRLRAARRDHVG